MSVHKILTIFLLAILVEEGLKAELLGLLPQLPLPGLGITPKPPLCIKRSSGTSNSKLPKCSFDTIQLSTGRTISGSTYHKKPFPSWINLPLARQGQAFARKHKFSVSYSAVHGLIAGVGFPDARDVLSFTKASDTPDKSIKRYVASAIQMLVWYDSVLSMDLNNNVFLTSISNVRALHINAANKANSAPKPINDPNKYADIPTDDAMWEAFKADLKGGPEFQKYRDYPAKYTDYDANATYINQFMQGVTLAGFMGGAILYPKACFLHDGTDEGFRGFLHLWAIIGYAIGIDDEYNICLQPTVEDARNYFRDLQNKYVIPSLYKIDKAGKVLVEAFLKGVANGKIPSLTPRTFMLRLVRDFLKVPVPHMTAILSPSDVVAMKGWDNGFVPSTRLPTTKLSLNAAVDSLMETFILTNFGLYVTNKQKAENVFFPKPGEEFYSS